MEHALDTQRELCKVCARHPDNAWCRGKCAGYFGRLGAGVDRALDTALDAGTGAVEDARDGVEGVEQEMRRAEHEMRRSRHAGGAWGPGWPLKSGAMSRSLAAGCAAIVLTLHHF